MKLAILYAMKKEAAGLLQKFPTSPLPDQGGVKFYTLGDDHILCIGGVGKVNAAMSTQLLLDRFHVDAVLNAGCAGALTDLAVGTVVTATSCVQHDVDTALAGDPPGFVSTVNRVEFPCLVPKASGLLPGVVATGDWFARDYGRAAVIRDTYRALVCDMECAAVAQVCLRHKLPFLALKAVSDHLFSPCQNEEYQENFPTAMAALDAAVAAVIKEME